MSGWPQTSQASLSGRLGPGSECAENAAGTRISAESSGGIRLILLVEDMKM